MSPLYYNIPFDSQYTLDTALKDDIDELWHKDKEQLEQILDAELKEAEWVNHELHSRKRKIIHTIQTTKRKRMEMQEELSQYYKSGCKQHIADGDYF